MPKRPLEGVLFWNLAFQIARRTSTKNFFTSRPAQLRRLRAPPWLEITPQSHHVCIRPIQTAALRRIDQHRY
jgi:hypothetical protein